MILCVGTLGCGKSALLKSLQATLEKKTPTTDKSGSSGSNTNPNPPAKTISKIPNTIPTVGTNLVELVRERKKKNVTLPPDVVVIREVCLSLWLRLITPN